MSNEAVVTAFRWVPDFAKGHVRDLRVRWALEEVGQPYQTRLLDRASVKAPAHRDLQPFGQVPTFEHDGVTLFESGAILLYIARRWKGLLPDDPIGAAKAEQWVFAAINSVEPVVMNLAMNDLFEADQPWSEARRPICLAWVRERLADLTQRLGERDYLESSFTAGDLMMVCVLRGLGRSEVLAEFPTLAAYVARAQARPAFQRALAAQLGDFDDVPPMAA